MDLAVEIEMIRPYCDAEVPAAIARVIKEKHFKDVVSFLYPDKEHSEIIEMFKGIKTVSEFQRLFSHYAVREIARQTSDGISFSGLDELDNSKGYLFIANHRDIVLDSAMMQVLLVENNHQTSQITFGSNLMHGEFVIDMGKLNKMFTLYRGGSKLQMYRNAVLHSEYIRQVISEKNESVWIAQRDGRTKDGNDKTQSALIKMLTIGKKEIIPTLRELNIVPVTTSYEYEPCDAQKTQELFASMSDTYKKQPGEDLNSILSGIKGYKGHIHMAFGKPINHILDQITDANIAANELVDMVVDEIDYQVYRDYALWPGNYVAYDIRNKTDKYIDKYDTAQKNKFVDYISNKVASLKGDKDELTSMMMRMYATPVRNKNTTEKYSVKK